MTKMKDIFILGRPIQLQERSKAQMKGVTIGDSLAYKFYDGEFHGMPLLFAESKGKVATPRSLSVTASNLTSLFQLPTVFMLPACPAYERQRLIDKDVYFVVSDKFAYLPMLLANERIRKTKLSKALTPVAQYLLLYHLQIESIEGLAARDIEDKIPYSYASITLGITCLEDLGLCRKVADGSKRKTIHFDKAGKELWEQAQPFLISPVEERIYCDSPSGMFTTRTRAPVLSTYDNLMDALMWSLRKIRMVHHEIWLNIPVFIITKITHESISEELRIARRTR